MDARGGLPGMVEIVREFMVKQEAQGRFELAFGPGGAWSKLFAQSPGFRGTSVLRDANNPRRYLTIDLWDTVVQRDQAIQENKVAYTGLEADFGSWTESSREVGTFRILAQTSVRPRSRPGRRREAGRRRAGRREDR